MKNPETTTNQPKLSRNILMSALAFGAILSSTHGGLNGGNHHFSQPTEFHAKVVSESHIHGESGSTNIPVDPRALKNVRSDGNKNHDRDASKNGWEVYDA
jgi:hypothetical protein